MTIEALEQVHHDPRNQLPPVLGYALDLMQQVEQALPRHDIHSGSVYEDAIVATRALDVHIEDALQVALGFAPDPQRALSLVQRARGQLERLIDETLVIRGTSLTEMSYHLVEDKAAAGHRAALRAIEENSNDPDSTGGFCPPKLTAEDAAKQEEDPSLIMEDLAPRADDDPEVVDVFRLARHAKEQLDRVRQRQLDLCVEEAEVALSGSVLGLQAAIETADKATVIELSGAVRLIIEHVALDYIIPSPEQ